MKVTLGTNALDKVRVDLLALTVGADELQKHPQLKALNKASGGALNKQISLQNFEAKSGQSLKVAVAGIGATQLLLLGRGSEEATPAFVRLAAARAAREAMNYKSLAFVSPNEEVDALRAASSGILAGAYRYTTYLTGDRRPKQSLSTAKVLVETKVRNAAKAIRDGVALGESVNAARDLVNAPPNDMNPPALADFAKNEAKKLGIQCKVWDKKGVKRLGMHLLLAVNAGSDIEPRFIHMTYKPDVKRKVPKVVFVGKGLTFDAGGLCLKPGKSMLDMKCDMGGSATTIGIILAAARLKVPVEVHAIVGSTENMTGGSAYRPGDVFPSLDGKSVEIINTDAEGRLVLADALAYARKLNPDYLIDHATLTGACMVALGPETAGLYSDDEAFVEKYRAAAEAEGESYWRLPLTKSLVKTLRSNIADLKHTGGPYGGSITAALFLREFVGDCTWLHLDIAGPAFGEAHNIHPKGGSGFGVMTGVRFLESL